MPISQRQHTRFSLDIPATIHTKFGEPRKTLLQQISIGGCFTGWEENIYAGDEFRLEIELPNKNRLPIQCKAIYRFENAGIGVKFVEISRFEQDLVSKVISERLIQEGLPPHLDPFTQGTKFIQTDDSLRITDTRKLKDEMLERIMSGDD